MKNFERIKGQSPVQLAETLGRFANPVNTCVALPQSRCEKTCVVAKDGCCGFPEAGCDESIEVWLKDSYTDVIRWADSDPTVDYLSTQFAPNKQSNFSHLQKMGLNGWAYFLAFLADKKSLAFWGNVADDSGCLFKEAGYCLCGVQRCAVSAYYWLCAPYDETAAYWQNR